VRRYRPSRSWPVGGLALVAAAGAVLATGTLSASLDGGPEPAFAARIRQSVAGTQPVAEARAAIPAETAPASPSAFASPPPAAAGAGAWQIQVGAFRNAFAAEAHVRALARQVPELERLTLTHQLRGKINRVRIGGIEDEEAARELCARIRAVGRGCFVAGTES
jgi:cell division septation protein DedD